MPNVNEHMPNMNEHMPNVNEHTHNVNAAGNVSAAPLGVTVPRTLAPKTGASFSSREK